MRTPTRNISCFYVPIKPTARGNLLCDIKRAGYIHALQTKCSSPPIGLDWHGFTLPQSRKARGHLLGWRSSTTSVETRRSSSPSPTADMAVPRLHLHLQDHRAHVHEPAGHGLFLSRGSIASGSPHPGRRGLSRSPAAVDKPRTAQSGSEEARRGSASWAAPGAVRRVGSTSRRRRSRSHRYPPAVKTCRLRSQRRAVSALPGVHADAQHHLRRDARRAPLRHRDGARTRSRQQNALPRAADPARLARLRAVVEAARAQSAARAACSTTSAAPHLRRCSPTAGPGTPRLHVHVAPSPGSRAQRPRARALPLARVVPASGS